MTWALRRQIFYVALLLVFFGVVAYFLASPVLNKAPTCYDSKQNGEEVGVDCGGSCKLACIAEMDNIDILWARAFRVVPGRYNAVAYLENHNPNAAVEKIHYRFRFADKDNVYIGKREGVTTVPPSSKFAVFEPAIGIGNSIPVYTTFEFTQAPTWVQITPEKIEQVKILTSDIKLNTPDTTPILSAFLKNNSLFSIPEVKVIAILYDETGNALATSSTFIEELKGEEGRNIDFTWPEPILGKVVATEILPLFYIDAVKLK